MRAITIRFPDELVTAAQTEFKSGESMNQLVIDAVADEVARRRAERAIQRAVRRVEEMRRSGRTGSLSEPIIRELREGRGRRA